MSTLSRENAYETVRSEIELLLEQLMCAENREVAFWEEEIARDAELMAVLRPERVVEMKLESHMVSNKQQLERARQRQAQMVEKQLRILTGLDSIRPGGAEVTS
jgi:hypothetical protein